MIFISFIFLCSCFLSNPIVFWLAFLGPILSVIFVNFVSFITVIVILVKHARRKQSHMVKSEAKIKVIRMIISLAGIMFLLGISWVFAALTFNVKEIRIPGQVLFVSFNSLQGFFIFLYICLCSKEARESWKEVLSCGKYISGYLHPSLKFRKNKVSTCKDHGQSAGNKSSIDCTLSSSNFPSNKKRSPATTSELAEYPTTSQKNGYFEQGHHGIEVKKENLSSTSVGEIDEGHRSCICSETEFNESNNLSAIKIRGDNESYVVTVVVPGINTCNIYDNLPVVMEYEGEDN